MADEFVDYDAEGLDEETGNLYGILISPSDEYCTTYSDSAHHGTLHIEFAYEFLEASGDQGPYPYSNYDVFRRDLRISGTLTGHREFLGEWLGGAGIPLAPQDDTVRLVLEHPEVMCLYVRIETIYVPRDYHEEEEEEDEDEDVEVDILEDYEEVLQQSMEDPCRLTPASLEAVNALMEKVTIRAGVEREMCCAVCLEDFSIGSEATKMPCSHAFHGDCILRWLEYQCVCPLCRFELPRAC